MRRAGAVLAGIVRAVCATVRPGATTAEIDQVCERLISAAGVRPAFKGYRGFPSVACISVNEEVVHGIPGDRTLTEGDIVSIDVGIIREGYYADTAVTVGVGRISEERRLLLNVTREALDRGIAQVKEGRHLSDISHAIQTFVEGRNLSVVRDFVGHGIGRQLHEEPEIPNFGPPDEGPILKRGMVFAIEPMVNMGSWKTRILEDGWTVSTCDGRPSAHFEHTVAVTERGPEILTQ